MDLSLKDELIKRSVEKTNADKEKASRILREKEDKLAEERKSRLHASGCSESFATQLFGPNDSTLLRILGER